MPLIPAPGGQTGTNLANAFLSQGLQRRGQGVGLAQMVASEKRRKLDRMLAMFEQFAQQRKQKREAKKAAGSGGKGGKLGGGLGAALGLALAIPTGGASLLALPALGAGLGSTVGGLFDEAPGGAPAVSGPQALSAGSNAANIIDKLGLFSVNTQFTEFPSASGGGTTASPGGALSLAGGFAQNPLAR